MKIVPLVTFVMTVATLLGSGKVEAVILQWEIGDGGNGRYYELVEESLNWEAARDAAAARSFLGSVGHLLTITSQEENEFLVDM